MNNEPSSPQRREDRGGRRGRGGRPPREGNRRDGERRDGDRGRNRGNRSFEPRNRAPGSSDRGPRQRDSRERGGDRPDRNRRPEREDEPRRRGEPGIEMEGRSVDDILQDAGRRFGVSRDQIKVQVISEGSKGFLGFLGGKPARVRIQLTPQAVPPYAEAVLAKVLKEMGLPDKVHRKSDTDGNTILDIQGPSGGVLIGRHGQTLESLQYVVAKILQRVTSDDRAKVIVDVESYRERQNDKLRELAHSMAHKAKESCEEVSMRPMSARDRRIVHMTLKDDPEVTTQSRGEGMSRRVVVIPKNLKPKAAPAAETQEPGDGSTPPGSTEPGNEPAEAAPETVPAGIPDGEVPPEPGNMAPKEPSVDDDIGNH